MEKPYSHDRDALDRANAFEKESALHHKSLDLPHIGFGTLSDVKKNSAEFFPKQKRGAQAYLHQR